MAVFGSAEQTASIICFLNKVVGNYSLWHHTDMTVKHKGHACTVCEDSLLLLLLTWNIFHCDDL